MALARRSASAGDAAGARQALAELPAEHDLEAEAAHLAAGLEFLEARSITDRRVAEALGGLPERKLHCSVLAEDAIRAALRNYESKRGGSRWVPAPEESR